MKAYFEDQKSVIYHGDCRDLLPNLEENSVDSIVTDPPYELGFMGKTWDSSGVAYDPRMWAKCLQILKPGGHLLSFGGSRTYHRMACAIEDAGFEIRDQIMWIYGSGFPKSKNLKGDWDGWGTALKPAHEPICVARKPLIGTVSVNVAAYGTGAINIDGCRIGGGEDKTDGGCSGVSALHAGGIKVRKPVDFSVGRWPANIIHDGSDEVLDAFPKAPGQLIDVKFDSEERKTQSIYGAMKRGHEPSAERTYEENGGTNFAMRPGARRLDSGSAARFFYTAKADRWDRNEGCDALDAKPLLWSSGTKNPGSFQAEGTDRSSKNNHPTVKPTDLMRYLCRLVTPPGGLILDPFTGSGSTRKAALAENFRFIGIELEEKYCAIAALRVVQDVLDFSQ